MKKKIAANIKLPKILDAYLRQGPAATWLRFHLRMWILTCAFIGGLSWHFLGFHWVTILVGGITGFLLAPAFGMIILSHIPKKVTFAELKAQLETPESEKDLITFDREESTYNLNDFKGVSMDKKGRLFKDEPKQVKSLKSLTENEQEALIEYMNTFADIALAYIHDEFPLEKMQKAHQHMQSIAEAVAHLTNTEIPVWHAIETTGKEFDVRFGNGEQFTCPSSIIAINTATGKVAEFDLVPGWDKDKILSAEELAQVILKIKDEILETEVPYEFTDVDGRKSSARIPSTFVFKRIIK